jgi:hypothetical protein
MVRARRQSIPDDIQSQVDAIVDTFNTRVIRDPNRYYCTRYRGNHLYLDRLDYGMVKARCRLTYTGRMDTWEFAIYKYSDERYDPDEWMFPGAGYVDGTIEGAMKAGLEAYP